MSITEMFLVLASGIILGLILLVLFVVGVPFVRRVYGKRGYSQQHADLIYVGWFLGCLLAASICMNLYQFDRLDAKISELSNDIKVEEVTSRD